jgi:hypothetical protein
MLRGLFAAPLAALLPAVRVEPVKASPIKDMLTTEDGKSMPAWLVLEKGSSEAISIPFKSLPKGAIIRGQTYNIDLEAKSADAWLKAMNNGYAVRPEYLEYQKAKREQHMLEFFAYETQGAAVVDKRLLSLNFV